MTTIINLFAGPGAGKSTTAARVFSELKMKGISCELVTEFAKDKVWEQCNNMLHNQVYVFGKQFHRIWRLIDQVDYVVTDSPLLLSIIYGEHETDIFHQLVLEKHKTYPSINYIVPRMKKFVEAGRLHNEKQAREIDDKVLALLKTAWVDYYQFDTYEQIISHVTYLVEQNS